LINDFADVTKTVRRPLLLVKLYLHWYFLEAGFGLENQGAACQLEEGQAHVHIADDGERDSRLLYISLVTRTLT